MVSVPQRLGVSPLTSLLSNRFGLWKSKGRPSPSSPRQIMTTQLPRLPSDRSLPANLSLRVNQRLPANSNPSQMQFKLQFQYLPTTMILIFHTKYPRSRQSKMRIYPQLLLKPKLEPRRLPRRLVKPPLRTKGQDRAKEAGPRPWRRTNTRTRRRPSFRRRATIRRFVILNCFGSSTLIYLLQRYALCQECEGCREPDCDHCKSCTMWAEYKVRLRGRTAWSHPCLLSGSNNAGETYLW